MMFIPLGRPATTPSFLHSTTPTIVSPPIMLVLKISVCSWASNTLGNDLSREQTLRLLTLNLSPKKHQANAEKHTYLNQTPEEYAKFTHAHAPDIYRLLEFTSRVMSHPCPDNARPTTSP